MQFDSTKLVTANSEEWFRLWDSTAGSQGSTDRGYDVAIDGYGYCYLAGVTWLSSSNSDAFLVKFDSNGNQIWNRTWGGFADGDGRGVAVDSATNSCYLVGADSAEAFIVKYDLEGNQKWNRTWGDSGYNAANGVAVDFNNNIYIACISNKTGQLTGDGFIIKFDPLGNQLWNSTWGGPDGDEATGVGIDNGNNCYLVGATLSFGAGLYDFFIAKYNSTGTQLWNRTWGGTSWDFCQSIAVDSMNNCYLVGDFAYHEAVLLKLDSEGNELWYQTWYGCSGSDGGDVAIDNESNCYLVGSTSVYTYSDQYSQSAAVIVKYSPSGDELGFRLVYEANSIYGGGAYLGYGVAIDANYNYYLSGVLHPYVGSTNEGAFLLKSDILYPSRISGFEWLFALIIGQLVSLVIIKLKDLKINSNMPQNRIQLISI